jgi:hypothetical protein
MISYTYFIQNNSMLRPYLPLTPKRQTAVASWEREGWSVHGGAGGAWTVVADGDAS